MARRARNADRADDPAADNDRNAAIREAGPEGEHAQPHAPTGDRIFERLGRPAKLDRGASLGFGKPDRGELRVVEQCSIRRLAPESTIAIDTPHLFVVASASAAAMIFFAAAIEMGSP